jgi:hypothetical protein
VSTECLFTQPFFLLLLVARTPLNIITDPLPRRILRGQSHVRWRECPKLHRAEIPTIKAKTQSETALLTIHFTWLLQPNAVQETRMFNMRTGQSAFSSALPLAKPLLGSTHAANAA